MYLVGWGEGVGVCIWLVWRRAALSAMRLTHLNVTYVRVSQQHQQITQKNTETQFLSRVTIALQCHVTFCACPRPQYNPHHPAARHQQVSLTSFSRPFLSLCTHCVFAASCSCHMSQRSNDCSISDAGASALGFALRSNTTLKKVGSGAWIGRVVLYD